MGRGAFMVIGIDIEFEGATSFERNNGSTTSSNVKFVTNPMYHSLVV